MASWWNQQRVEVCAGKWYLDLGKNWNLEMFRHKTLQREKVEVEAVGVIIQGQLKGARG